jgi:hypothetical protein
VDGRYSRSDYNVSFVGFVPSRDPLFTVVVVVDSPKRGSAFGGVVAAPIFQRIANAALRHRGVPPSINAEPPLLVASRAAARQQPTTGPVRLPAIVALAGTSHASSSLFPDLRGLSARDALRSLARLGVTGQLHGAGLVVAQRPQPGTPIEQGTSSTVWLQRQPPSRPPSATEP